MSEHINENKEEILSEGGDIAEKFAGALESGEGAPTEGRFRTRKRRRVSYLTINNITSVDYKDVNLLKRFINDHGKIVSTRQSGNNASQQRMIAKAIRRAREVALLPFVVTEIPKEKPYTRYSRTPREHQVSETPAAPTTQAEVSKPTQESAE